MQAESFCVGIVRQTHSSYEKIRIKCIMVFFELNYFLVNSLISNNNFMDVCLFMEQWLSPSWISQSADVIAYFLEIFAVFAQR